jgi:glyoxylase-like metal-dependent hydrolase (beta-lactamase superfamily II)
MMTIIASLVFLAAASCATVPPPQKPPLTQQRDVEAYMTVAAYPNADTLTILAAMNQLMASRREWEGYAFFGRLAEARPERRAFFRSLQAIMQARVAGDVPLLKRVAWVEDAIAKLDDGVGADPVLGRFGRGLVFADLPERFGKAREAIADLEYCIAHRAELPAHFDRGIYLGLAAAHHTLGDEARSRQYLTLSGVGSLDGVPRVLGNSSFDPENGYRYSERRFVREADGVYVAEGFDFASLAFIVTNDFVVAIDAGTTPATARAAVDELRKVTRAPIKYVVLSHAHWDHIGGLSAVREPGSIVIAQADFAKELARSRLHQPPFFGAKPVDLDVTPDRLVSKPEALTDGGLDLEIIPVRGGETDDALFVHDKKHGLLFVADAFMPYVGDPFGEGGSPEGYLAAIDTALALHPQRLLHGHPPLTAFFTIEALPGLRDALHALYDRTLAAAHVARPLSEVLHDNFLPETLRGAPKAVAPYLVTRDQFVQRVYAKHAGYWRSNGEGMDHFTRGEWAAALDVLGGRSESSFVKTVDELNERGDSLLALRIADMGLERYASSADLKQRRERTLALLLERYSEINPFRFILYSEWANRSLAPVAPK